MASGDKARDRSPLDRDRKRRVGPGGIGGGNKSGGRRAPPECRVFVSNIPFDMKWQELKDMFREHVGDVTYVELFSDENDKPRGCGILEFGSKDLAKKAVDKMHRFDLKGRKLVVKEDFDVERDKQGRIVKGSTGGGGGAGNRGDHRGDRDRGGDRERSIMDRLGPQPASSGFGNTYGLSTQFLESLGIDGPLHTRVFVANLVYTVDEKKLREVFRLAGRCVSVELSRDKEGKSRGHAVIEYDHPVEAVQAISMFNNQPLYDRKMTCRLDKQPGLTPEEQAQLPSRLPEGLGSVGMGLGSNGNPLTEVAKNLANQQGGSSNNQGGGGGMNGLLSSVAPNNNSNPLNDLSPAVAGMALLARQMGLNLNNTSTMNTLAGALASNLGNLGNTGLGMQNSGMNNLASNLGNMGNVGGMNMPSGGLNLGGGMGSSMPSGGLSGLGNNMGPQGGGMGGNMNMGSGMGLNSGSGLNMPMNASGPGMDGMGSRGGNGVGGGYNSSGAGYGPGSNLPISARPGGLDNPASMSRGGVGAGMGGGIVRSSDTIVIRNLPNDCNWQDLRELFTHCGEVKYAEMKERGTGLVRFNSERDAERAVSMMDNTTKGGRIIDVRLY